MLVAANRFHIGFALLTLGIGVRPAYGEYSRLHMPPVFAAEHARSASEDIADDELASYAHAKERADEIIAFWSESISRSRSADVLRSVRDNEIEIAVGREGLSLARYREIESLVKKNEELQAAVGAILNK